MPHLTIEYSANLPHIEDADFLCTINKAVLDSGLFEEFDLKTRLLPSQHFLIGLKAENRAFVHLKLSMLTGRDKHIKQSLSEHLLLALQKACQWPMGLEIQLCVEILEIERDLYQKALIL